MELATIFGLCAIGQRLLIRNDLEGFDHIPVAALGIVSELSDRVPRRQALDTPCRLANFESLLENSPTGTSCGKERGRMGQSLVWITNRGIRGLGPLAMRVDMHSYPLN
jgi:hypothetical protein